MTPIYRYPARQYRGNFAIAGTLNVDTSAVFTGPVECATSLDVDATLDVTGYTDLFTTVTSCAVNL